MAFWSKKLILAALLLSSSFVLDRIGGSNRLFVIASFLLSAIGFVTTIYRLFFSCTVPAVTRSESERQLIAVDIVFSFIQLVLTSFQLIRVFLGAKSNNNNNESLLPLASAVISVVFIFRNNEEAHVFSDLASVNRIIFRNNEEDQVFSDSASVNQIILLETPAVDDESVINRESNNEEAQVVSDWLLLGTPAVDDESAINRESSTLRRRITSTKSVPTFIVSKALTYYDITGIPSLPTKILQHIGLPQGERAAELQVADSREQVWTFRLYTRPTGNRVVNPVFTKGWMQFARAKRLKAGDKLTIYGRQDGELQIQVTRKSNVTFQEEPVYLDVEDFL